MNRSTFSNTPYARLRSLISLNRLTQTDKCVAVQSAHGKLPALRVSPKAVTIFLGAWAVFTFLRNLPWAPFTLFFV